MNIKTGKIAACVTGLSVLAFAVSLIVGLFVPTLFSSCLTSMFIALGFVPFMVSVYTQSRDKDKTAVGLTGVAFAAVYAVIICLVYYAECTTVRMNPQLGEEALSIISYGQQGSLFFNYDLLGYAFMALSTFFIGCTIKARDKGDKALRRLLKFHGIFFFPCLIMPMFPVFTVGTSAVVGTVLLSFWCLYFLPICILGYRFFRKA